MLVLTDLGAGGMKSFSSPLELNDVPALLITLGVLKRSTQALETMVSGFRGVCILCDDSWVLKATVGTGLWRRTGSLGLSEGGEGLSIAAIVGVVVLESFSVDVCWLI